MRQTPAGFGSGAGRGEPGEPGRGENPARPGPARGAGERRWNRTEARCGVRGLGADVEQGPYVGWRRLGLV